MNATPLFRTVHSVACLTVLAVLALSGTAGAESSAPAVVIAKNFMFSPVNLTVKAGTTVTWSNEDDEPHTIVSGTGLFRSAALDTHDSFSYRFRQAGTYRFICSIHPQMIGTIIVR